MAKPRVGSPIAALLGLLRRRHNQFAKNVRLYPRSFEAGRARTHRPASKSNTITERDQRVALDASLDLADDIKVRAWEMPPEKFEVSFEYISTGAAVTLIAENDEGERLTRGFLVASIDPQSFDATIFLEAFQHAGLVPHVYVVEVVPQEMPTAH